MALLNTKDNSMENKILWSPDQKKIDSSLLVRFIKEQGLDDVNYDSIWSWSVREKEQFWSGVWDFCSVIGEKGNVVLTNKDKMLSSSFFPEARINYAENLLKRRDNHEAIIFCNENEEERSLTFSQLYDQVSLWQSLFVSLGIKEGDRIAGVMPNMPETIVAMLAAASLGAIWSSASPDFGAQGILDRFTQVTPKVLISVDGYFYNGKSIDCLAKLEQIQPQLSSIEKTIIVPFLSEAPDLSNLKKTSLAGELLSAFSPETISFKRVSFDHPLFIMFSSGTTGIPKCIVHGHGGTLLQHLKEHQLHCDVRPDDHVFYFTTCGWMMWNWLVTGLASGACLLLYDGSPFYPDPEILWRFTSKHQCTLFGTAAKYIDALNKNDIAPGKDFNLEDLRTITSTGSPLVHEGFDYVYSHIKQDVHLASISGGTDIISCFVLGAPILPVYRGEIQCAGLGMDIDVYDENGDSIAAGSGAGELVCKSAFPSMPVKFWNDEDGMKYKDAYFDKFDNVWCHGDWVEKTINNGFIIHGRSDATLNPGGVRIGTSEIYRQVEQIPEIIESIAVGQEWQGDVRVVLFVRLREGVNLDEQLTNLIKSKIRSGASPRHVPAKILSVEDIPRTKSNKITELAVKNIIHGKSVKNVEALANPEALKYFKDREELKS